jgi:hypothetical protein
MNFIKTFESFNKNIDDEFINGVLNGYLSSALWTAELDKYGTEDFDEQDVNDAKKEVEYFIYDMNTKGYLKHLQDKLKPFDIGHNFWLTRNGHGAGFWDKPELDQEIADKVSDILRNEYKVASDPVYNRETNKVEFY